MAENSAIEWTDHTFNPWIGCTAVSLACDHCYAETLMDKRYGRVTWGAHGERSTTGASTWRQPRLWQKRAAEFFAEHGRRQRVFCASLADVFDNKAPAGVRDRLWQLIRETPDLDWLLLTKRPQNIAKMLPAFWGEIRGRVWLGASTENQVELVRRQMALEELFLSVARPAVVFASAEPLLGPLNFAWSAEPMFQWIIAGGESGPGARPTHPEWIRSIRDQCAAAGIAYLFKQWGEWAPVMMATDAGGEPGPAYPMPGCSPALAHNAAQECRFWQGDSLVHWPDVETFPAIGARRVGKKAAGRLLDGVTHDGFPASRLPHLVLGRA